MRHADLDQRSKCRGRDRPWSLVGVVGFVKPPPVVPRPPPASSRSTSRAGPSLPSTPGASKHQATALPNRPRIGRAAARPRRRHTLVTNHEGQPHKVTPDNVVSVDDANPATRPQPGCRSTRPWSALRWVLSNFGSELPCVSDAPATSGPVTLRARHLRRCASGTFLNDAFW